jgi:formate hydrogenlyase subunit 6/NADH:ubiquinone oxidoreductase subunit I
MSEVAEVNVDTCIGCQLCAKFCPPDYDAVHMFPFDEGIRLAEAEERNFNYRIYDKKDGGAIPA